MLVRFDLEVTFKISDKSARDYEKDGEEETINKKIEQFQAAAESHLLTLPFIDSIDLNTFEIEEVNED